MDPCITGYGNLFRSSKMIPVMTICTRAEPENSVVPSTII